MAYSFLPETSYRRLLAKALVFAACFYLLIRSGVPLAVSSEPLISAAALAADEQARGPDCRSEEVCDSDSAQPEARLPAEALDDVDISGLHVVFTVILLGVTGYLAAKSGGK